MTRPSDETRRGDGTPRQPFRLNVDKDRFLAALDKLPELECGAGGFLVMCNCASTPPTIPTYRTEHLPTCPACPSPAPRAPHPETPE